MEQNKIDNNNNNINNINNIENTDNINNINNNNSNENFELWVSIIKESIDKKNIAPWNINISEIADEYIKTIKKLHKFDIRLSAEVVLVGSILLKLKSQILYGECENTFEEEVEEELIEEDYLDKEQYEDYVEEDLLNNENNINNDDIINKNSKKEKRQKNITFNDLITTLKSEINKVNKQKNKKISNKKVIYEIKKDMDEEEDISDLMEKVLNELKKEKEIIYQNKYIAKEQLIKNFLPSLYLANDGTIEIIQEKIFDKIILKIKE